MDPLEMGVVLEEAMGNKALSAEIIYLATLGYLKLVRAQQTKLPILKTADYELLKLKEPDAGLNQFAAALMRLLFSNRDDRVLVSSLKADREFFLRLKAIEKSLLQNLEEHQLFLQNPRRVKRMYVGLGVAGGVLLTVLLAQIAGGFGLFSGILASLVAVIFGALMPARTAKGVAVKDHILGLKEYLSVAEADRLTFHNAPQRNPQRFEKLLPYAVVLGVEKEWARQFEGMYEQKPAWYEDSAARAVSAASLAQSVAEFNFSINSALTSRNRAVAGGSGFVRGGAGGGFGGGGGRSW
jgi:uncharacterized membrane protein YgcG